MPLSVSVYLSTQEESCSSRPIAEGAGMSLGIALLTRLINAQSVNQSWQWLSYVLLASSVAVWKVKCEPPSQTGALAWRRKA